MIGMRSVWIVFDDEETMSVLGVFDTEDEAENYAGELFGIVPQGAKYAEYSVPWRLTDKSTAIIM